MARPLLLLVATVLSLSHAQWVPAKEAAAPDSAHVAAAPYPDGGGPATDVAPISEPLYSDPGTRVAPDVLPVDPFTSYSYVEEIGSK